MNVASLLRHKSLAALAFLAGAIMPTLAHAQAQQPARETFARERWWLHTNVFAPGDSVDLLFDGILYLTSAVCLAVFVVMIVFLVRYRYKPGRRAIFIHGNSRLEMVWTLIPAVILVMISALSQSTWSQIKSPQLMPQGEDVLEMRIVARQFAWYFWYPGADNKLGPRNTALIDLASSDVEKHTGIDRSHPDAKDDIIVPATMVIPVDKKVRIHLTSSDVLHSFFLPNFRIKQDAVPGMNVRVWLESREKSGDVMGVSPMEREEFGYAKPFDVICAELCGQGHFKMAGQLYVVTEEQYAAFMAEQAQFLPGDEEEDF